MLLLANLVTGIATPFDVSGRGGGQRDDPRGHRLRRLGQDVPCTGASDQRPNAHADQWHLQDQGRRGEKIHESG